MIPLLEFKKLLGAAAEGLSDDEISRIRDTEYALADSIIEYWLRKKNASKGDLTQQD